ncbi:MAG: PAS domain S-box protein [Chloroflexi bacterium]|nr:PAS domain S-box protein [Chloroflexota bacterium]
MSLVRSSAHIRWLQWMLPLALGALAFFDQIGPGRWIHDIWGDPAYFGVDIFFYATVVPLLAFLTLRRFAGWLEEKERAEKQVRATERRLASITSASADAILGLDSAGHIESWNRGAEMLFGFWADEIRGRPLTDLLASGESAHVEARWLMETTQTAGFVRGHETTCHDADGRIVQVELTATRLADTPGENLGMSVILRDITERKRRDDEIQRLNANLSEQVGERTRELAEKVEQLARANTELRKLDQMRSEFVSLVSHQLRAPLTNMNGAVAQIATDCAMMNPTCDRMVTILNQQVERLDHLVRDVLNTASIEAGELALHPEPISVLPTMRQVIEQIRARTARRTFHLPDKPGLPLVYADRDRVAEVLANLCDNADKYSPPDQPIIVEARADETEVTLSVRDFGAGILPNDLQRIFDKFYRADSSDSQAAYGYGLGLYICRRLVQAHQGRIWVENHPDGGAVFSFTLPIANSI